MATYLLASMRGVTIESIVNMTGGSALDDYEERRANIFLPTSWSSEVIHSVEVCLCVCGPVGVVTARQVARRPLSFLRFSPAACKNASRNSVAAESLFLIIGLR